MKTYTDPAIVELVNAYNTMKDLLAADDVDAAHNLSKFYEAQALDWRGRENLDRHDRCINNATTTLANAMDRAVRNRRFDADVVDSLEFDFDIAEDVYTGRKPNSVTGPNGEIVG